MTDVMIDIDSFSLVGVLIYWYSKSLFLKVTTKFELEETKQ